MTPAEMEPHIAIPHGFTIGAAGQPPKCRNSRHSHRTAEVFFVLSGRWGFFWGRWGKAGEVVLEAGDIVNIPTGLFRGFGNIGTDHGRVLAIPGGDDAGGGVIWAPQVIADAADHGLVPGENGKLYDSKKGQTLPDGVAPMPVLDAQALKAYPEMTPAQIVGMGVRRYNDMMALGQHTRCKAIGQTGVIRDKPGSEVDLITRGSASDRMHRHDCPSVLMPMRGHWRVMWDGGVTTRAPGDTMSVPDHIMHSGAPSMTREVSLYHIVGTNDPGGVTWHG